MISHATPPFSFVEQGNQHPQNDSDHKPGPASPLFRCMIGLVWMVVGVIDEVIRDGMAMLGVELLHEGLGCLFLLEAELVDEALCLDFPEAAYLAEVKVRGDGLDGVELIGADSCFFRLAVGSVDGDMDPVIPHPFLGRFGNTWVSGCNSLMTAMDVGVGEPGARNPCRGPAAGATEGVVRSPTPDTQGGALGTKVPTNSGEEFD